jgi:hypothetical protein
MVTAWRLRMSAAPFLFSRTTSFALAPGAIFVLSVPTRVADAALAWAPLPATVSVTFALHFGPVAGQLTCRPVSRTSEWPDVSSRPWATASAGMSNEGADDAIAKICAPIAGSIVDEPDVLCDALEPGEGLAG